MKVCGEGAKVVAGYGLVQEKEVVKVSISFFVDLFSCVFGIDVDGE